MKSWTIMRLVNVHPVLLRSIHPLLLDTIKPEFQERLQLLGVVTPSIIIISIIAGLITNFSSLAIVQHALNGIRVAVCMLMINAVLKLGKGNIKNKIGFLIFAVALIFAMFTKVSTVLLVIGAGIAGVVFSRIGWLKKNA